MTQTAYDVIIIGGGPAGLTAGLYTARAGLKSLLIERGAYGGQIVNAPLVENYPGFPDGVPGIELGALMQKQAAKYGLETLTGDVSALEAGKTHKIKAGDKSLEAGAVIIATGSEYRKLGVPGEETLVGHGVSYCATCDGFFFRQKEVAVVGGGDAAITDAIELVQHASKVYVIHRRDQLRAGKVLEKRAKDQPKVEFVWDSVVEEVVGGEVVKALKLRNVKTDKISTLVVDGVFVAVGLEPNSQQFANTMKLTKNGNIVTDGDMATSAAGIFAAGDVRRASARQVATAVGDGAAAALAAFAYLRE
ncbi:MAG: thioredoxin-disulfide reductase [Dehalococcoidia bacterium]|jgi:thioredoxin reductase (NADPH)